MRSPRGHSPTQAGETELLREALLRAERDWQQRAAGAAQTAQASQHSEDTVATRLTRTLSRPLGKPLARLSKLASPEQLACLDVFEGMMGAHMAYVLRLVKGTFRFVW